MRSVIPDAVCRDDLLTVEAAGREVLYLAIATAEGREPAIALDLDGAERLALVLVEFLRNHPDAMRGDRYGLAGEEPRTGEGERFGITVTFNDQDEVTEC